MNENKPTPTTIKKSELKTLVKAIIQEIRTVKSETALAAEHRGAKGSRVGQVRSKNFPQGKGGKLAAKVAGAASSKGNEEALVKKFLGKAKSTDNLLDVADVLGIQIPPNASRFDPADIAKVILDVIYKDGPGGQVIVNKELIDKAYNFLMAAGFIKESISSDDQSAPVVERAVSLPAAKNKVDPNFERWVSSYGNQVSSSQKKMLYFAWKAGIASVKGA